MIASALGSGPKSKLAPPPARFKPSDITANAATVEDAPPPRGQKKGEVEVAGGSPEVGGSRTLLSMALGGGRMA